ncbi:MAG: BREX-1 system phosphatase PglZ type A, partial [Pyrinomonadaceae bacterium]|nr:BREX-1 system phosphatase PglZ type A [Pyrinomonadaceae bacterium]
MNIAQITETLAKFYGEGNHRVIFWNDAEGEFLENIDALVPADVALLRVDETGSLAAKIRLEIEEPQRKFLVYAPTAQSAPEADWLLDIRLYSKTFTADAASLLLNELGLQTQSLREYLGTRKQFFAGKERLQKLKKWIQPEDTAKDLDKKMLAVTVRADQPETFIILLKIFGDFITEAEKSGRDLSDFEPEFWKEIVKYNLTEYFWRTAAENFGYAAENPRLYDLLVHLFVTDFALHVRDNLPNALQSLKLENRAGAVNAAVFLANWRTNTAQQENYRKASNSIERELEASIWIGSVKAENLTECETFEAVERRIIADLRDRLLAPLPADTNEWQNTINARRDRFWCRGAENSYAAAYHALAAALDFFRLRDKYEKGFSFPSAAAIFEAYCAELFKFDQYYRRFCEAEDLTRFEGWNIFKTLTAEIEKSYGNRFLENFGTSWTNAVEHEKLFENWRIGNAANQYNFYRKFVKPLADESAERKIYVIISDAFRYECAEELTRELNTEARKNKNALLEANLSAMLGVVPSYTALGMAALLPHENLDYKPVNPNADTLYADDNSTAGLANRIAVLNKHKGTAAKFEEFINLGKDGGREFVRDFQIIYVYHNVIDAKGDSAGTESETFSAARQAISELRGAVGYIVNSLNGSQILITADHGFLFQENAPETIDRSSLDVKSGTVLKRKKRYVINPQIPPQENAWHGKIKNTARISGEMEFLIPKGANRFHFAGGARFVHGGAMPQEICVPVISIKKLRGRSAENISVKRVGVTLLGNLTRIVNNVQKFEFIQTEAVSERTLPRTLQFSLRDDQGEIISSEQTVTFDSSSNSMDDRRKNIQLTLRAG